MLNKADEKNSTAHQEVKSKAIVKYSVPYPAKFTKLQCNTNLNLPPSNWLSSSVESYGLQHVLYEQQGFSSFRMAHMFPDCVGEVDVVSDSENIKNLLKIPYHKGSVSMMVHRVENTLLLDDFDIYKHILRTAETEWEWLKRFFCENFKSNINQEQPYDSALYFKSKSRKALQQKSLVSKFLYHSLAENESSESLDLKNDDNGLAEKFTAALSEPSPEEVPDPRSHVHKHNRNVIWTFEDIRMLIGTDMPIFGQGTHPCISLRLRDMSKPISVLTGIDYWLDNLMSNVPEVVMCYHLNGIVQKYELIKTEDLPCLDNSKFAPSVIREVAKSILSFLKSNATKAGHTYWLFKPKDEDVVKLYDLTSLCSKYMVEKDESPFTVPVAMLLYRVARNMKHSCERHQPGTIRMLLKNCIKLLEETKYPEIVTSSNYMLSDLYIPASTNPESPNLEQLDSDCTESVFDDDSIPEAENDEEHTKTLILDADNIDEKFPNLYKHPPPIGGTVEERCLQALQHITSGLDCLQYFHKSDNGNEKKNVQEDEIPMAKSFEPIPMPYSTLNTGDSNNVCGSGDSSAQRNKRNKKRKDKNKKKDEASGSVCINSETSPNALLLKNRGEAQPLPTWQDFNDDHISWKDHFKILLYEKAELVYATLVEQQYVDSNYGASLRSLGLLVRCHQVLSRLYCSSNTLMEDCLLGRAGDCCIMIVQNWDKVENYKLELKNFLEEDEKMKQQLEKDEQLYDINHMDSNLKCVLIPDIRTIEQMLVKCVQLYDEALNYRSCESILLRLGNSLNELGTFFLNRARNSTAESIIFDSCNKAEPYLKRGLEIFEKIKNDSNVALLYTNIGHLHRILAHASSPRERCELTSKEKLHYNKAFINYKKALQVLGDRSHSPGIWDVVKWELSTALFTMATILHDHPNPALSRTDAEKEVTETLHQALKYCDLDEGNPKFPLYQFRAALIHYRLGSLNHSSIWNLINDTVNRKGAIHLSKLHYCKATSLFLASMDAINYFTVQMQRFALVEYLAESSSVPHVKVAHYQECLDILCDVKPMLQLIIDRKIELDDSNTGEENETSFKSLKSLIGLLQNRIQCTLRQLTKLCLTKPPINKTCSELANFYKQCYALTLKLDSNQQLYDVILSINSILIEIENNPLGSKNEYYRFLLSNDEKLNLAYIGALPNRAIEQVRIHWLFNLISLRIVNEVYVYNFTHLDSLLDWIRHEKLYPGFELMGVPQIEETIVSENTIKFDYSFWYNLTYEIVAHYKDRYGTNYLKKWRFETWNEPDLASYNILNFTLSNYLAYVQASADALRDSFIFNNITGQLLKFGGPAGLFKDSRKHPLCWGLLKICNEKNKRKQHGCPLKFISFHKKGEGTTYKVLNETVQLLNDIYRKYPRIRKTPVANDESDVIENWSNSMEWRGDARYAAMIAKLVIDYFKVLIMNMKVPVEIISFDNAFLNYDPFYFTQRTLLARFQMNNTNPSHIQFIKKPAYSVMGLLSLLGNEYLKEEIISSEPFVQFLTTRSVKNKNEIQMSLLITYSKDTEESNKDQKTIKVDFNKIVFLNCAYVVYILDNVYTNPFLLWKSFGAPVFPTEEFRQRMRQIEEPRRFASPSFIENSTLMVELNLTLPSVALINICSRSLQRPGRVTHLTAHNITGNEVLLLWKDAKVRSKCLRTYEVEFQPLKADEITKMKRFIRINEHDTIFLSYHHVATDKTPNKLKQLDKLSGNERGSSESVEDPEDDSDYRPHIDEDEELDEIRR
ncbi:hypothetical protein FQR65_LT01064 [Abscondita terminalis]|nr:hypothetical protein FQR65_LT01064 [Abscondita terminalis]